MSYSYETEDDIRGMSIVAIYVDAENKKITYYNFENK